MRFAPTPGFAWRGSGTKNLLVRAVGPTLAHFGVAGSLTDPRLEIISAGAATALLTNDDWSGTNEFGAASSAAGAFALAPGSKDAALIVSLPPGGYTVAVTGAGGGTGNVLVEIYDLDP